MSATDSSPVVPAPRGATVEVEGLTFTPYGAERSVLSEVTLTLAPGERVLLAGASGSGKSTLLRALAGVLAETGGGEVSGRVDVSAQTGLLLQDPSDAVVARTVGRDVAFGPECAGVERAEAWSRVREALMAVSFPYAESHETRALSGGEAQRLALAGVVALLPGLLLLDEPCSMLDPRAAQSVRAAVVAAVEAAGATLVVVEHRLDHWVDVCDRLVVLGHAGRVVADGPLRTTLAERGGELTDLGLWVPGAPAPAPVAVPRGLLAPAVRASVEAAIDLVERSVQPGLASWQVEHPPRVALADVSLTVSPGELLALTGTSGAGKSTVLGCLGGLLTPTRGRVAHRPHDGAKPVGWVPQRPELPIVARTVWDEALATARAVGADLAAAEERARTLLELVGLGERHDADPHTLSGGEQRRLSLVSALVHGPGLLLLDEPTVGQDRRTWSVVAGLAAAQAVAGGTVVVATHDRALAAQATREIVLDRPQQAEPPVRRRAVGLAAASSPLPLLLVALVGAVVGLTLPSVAAGLALLGVEVAVLLVLCGWRWPQPVLRLTPLVVGALSLWWSNWLWSPGRDMVAALLPALRMTVAALPGVVVAGYLEPFALGDHLGQRLRLPARPVVAATVALQRFDELRETYAELQGVRRVRGLTAPTGGSPWARVVGSVREGIALTFALLVLALRQAGRMAVAMEARGFSSVPMRSGRRTWAEPALWGRSDLGVVMCAVVLAAVGVVGGLLGR